jgi:hypothetical protein
MRSGRAALLGALALVGCSSANWPFQLSDVERLSVGESTREEVERQLGRPSSWSAHSTAHEAGTSTALPGPPFSFVLWPLYSGGRGDRCTVTVWYDGQNVLSEGTVTFDSHWFSDFALFFRAHGVDSSFDERLLEPLRRVELKGFRIQIAEGDRRLSLQRFLEKKRAPP